MQERTDVVVVGSRCAGSAAAIAFARSGRDVIALDGASFPSDTLSTHLFFPHHWAELELLGARESVLELGAPLHTRAGLGAPGVEVMGEFGISDGFTAGSCVRRPGLDLALVQTARAAGAEVRERTRVTDLKRDADGRVTGVRYRGRDGTEGTINAKLVVGADGRRSTIGRLVGTTEHHRWDNQRMMAYAYYEDTHQDSQDDLRHLAMQWRYGDDLVTVFPCDGGQLVALLMPPVARADDFRKDPEAAFRYAVRRIPPFSDRLRDCTRVSKIRVSYTHPSYFRHSQGPGWALAGDSGHFKDPVTAQGIRDALRFGRLLGESTAAHLDDQHALDAALVEWEWDRDEQCLPMYQWSNLLGRGDTVSPIEDAAYRWLAGQPDGASQLLDVFSRNRLPSEVFTAGRLIRWTSAAARNPDVKLRHLWRTVRRDVGREAKRIIEQRSFERRRTASAKKLGLNPLRSAGASQQAPPGPPLPAR